MSMKVKKFKSGLAILIAAACAHMPAPQALPLNTDVLIFQGAIFTLQGEWQDSRYIMTYEASFDGFQDNGEPSYLKAIDWKWQGDLISAVSLLEAPGGANNWLAQTDRQIGSGDSVGCTQGGGANAVCTEYLGDSKGFSTLTDLDSLRWVFELSFNELRQRDLFVGNGLRAAFVNGSGTLTAPIMACSGPQNPGCPDPQVEIQPVTAINANVPIPGVPALLLAGLAGLVLSRRRSNALSD